MHRRNRDLVVAVLAAGLAGSVVTAGTATAPATTSQPAKPPQPKPTHADVHYGPHERQILDFWQAPSDKPTPVVVYLHGGGWTNGNKGGTGKTRVEDYLAAGISVAAISYRYVPQAHDAGVRPPVQWPMHDGMRAVQFVRSKAAEWNLDKARLAMSGTSAGACTSLWVAFHDDLADPHSADPVARESTRLWCVAVHAAQTSLDPKQMQDWTPNVIYGGHAFGFRSAGNYEARKQAFADWLAKRDTVLPWINKYSPIAHATAGDPPVYLIYDAPPAMGQPQKDATHSANFGVKLKETLDAVGVPCELAYPKAPGVKHDSMKSYLIDTLEN